MPAVVAIRAGAGDFYAAGGMESMNLSPYLLTEDRPATGWETPN